MADLNDYRNKINDIDRQIADLICERMNTSKDIAKYKLENSIGILDVNRESQIIEARYNMLKEKGIDDIEFVKAIWGIFMIKSKQIQKELIDSTKNEA